MPWWQLGLSSEDHKATKMSVVAANRSGVRFRRSGTGRGPAIACRHRAPVLRPGHSMWEMYRLAIPLLAPVFRRLGFTDADLALLSAVYDYPEARMIQHSIVSSWGRRKSIS
jgi:hypothetical protein